MYLPSFNSDKRNATSCITIFFVIAGIFLRVYYYFLNRSLWIDEVYLSSSIVKMNMGQLLIKPLLYYQKAPLGFLFFEKLSTIFFTATELTLRLFPLICGILALILFVPLSKYYVKNKFAWAAVGIFAFSPALIYHATEVKQYSTELLFSIIILLGYIKWGRERNLKRVCYFGFLGAVSVWFSYPVIFILASIGFYYFIKIAKKREYKNIYIYAIPVFCWVLSFTLNYFFSTYRHAHSVWTIYWFDYYKHFAPFPPVTKNDWLWYPMKYHRMLDYPLGLWWNFINAQKENLLLKFSFIPGILLLLGIWHYRRDTQTFTIFLTAIILMFIASAMKLYPLTDRFWIFISPVFIILIINGYIWMFEKLKQNAWTMAVPIFLLIGPVMEDRNLFIDNNNFMYLKTSYQRETMKYIQSHIEKNDKVYVYWNDRSGFDLYNQLYKYKFTATAGKDYRWVSRNYAEYFSYLKKDINITPDIKRLWVICNYTFQSDIGEAVDAPKWYFQVPTKPTDVVIQELSKYGKIIDSLKKFDMQLYCIQLK